MPVFTPGSNTQRLTAAVVTERVVNFLLSLRKEESKSREVGGAGFGWGSGLRREPATHLIGDGFYVEEET